MTTPYAQLVNDLPDPRWVVLHSVDSPQIWEFAPPGAHGMGWESVLQIVAAGGFRALRFNDELHLVYAPGCVGSA